MGPREHVPYQPQHQTGLKDVCVPTPTGDSLAPPPPCRPPDHSRKKLPPAWRWLPSRRASSQRLEGRGPSAWRPKPRLQMKFQLSGPPAVLPHSRTKLPERSLKRWPGVGSSRMGTLARQCSRRARVPILPSNTPSRSRFCSISEQPSAIHSKDHQINWLRPFSIRICKSSFSLVPPSGAAPFENETSAEDRRYCASLRGEELSDSLLGTWAHFAKGSSRSRLCRTWLRNARSSPVGGTFGGQETCDEFLSFSPGFPNPEE